MTNEVRNPETFRTGENKTRGLGIIITVLVITVLAIFFLAPVMPVTGHCFAVPLRVLFSPSSMLTNHQVGAFYIENTNSYGVAPFSASPTVTYCE